MTALADRIGLLLANGQPIPGGPGVYLLHTFDPATGRSARYGHAGHYVGYAEDLPARIRVELAGTSGAANLVRIYHAAGLGLLVDQVWPGETRADERRRKNRGGAGQYCSRCLAEHPTTRGRQPQHRTPPRRPPEAAVRFLTLNPAFARPARAALAVQYSRVRGREETALLGARVLLALAEDNHPFSQNRAAVVITRARAAVRRAHQHRADQRAQRQAEQARPARLAARTHQHLTRTRAGRRGGRHRPSVPDQARSTAMHLSKPTPPPGEVVA